MKEKFGYVICQYALTQNTKPKFNECSLDFFSFYFKIRVKQLLLSGFF